MKLRFRVGRKEASKQGRKNEGIEALADAMRSLADAIRALKKYFKNKLLNFLTYHKSSQKPLV